MSKAGTPKGSGVAIVWVVADMIKRADLVTFLEEADAIAHARGINARRFYPRAQVERRHRVAGRVV